MERAQACLRDAEWAEQAGLPERAVAGYREVAALCPTVFEVHNNLANLLLSLGRPAEALESAQAAARLRPDDPLVNANLGQAHLQLGAGEQAVPCLRKALAALPELHLVRRQLVDTLIDLGRREEAVAALLEVEERFSDDIEFVKLMGQLCRRAEAGAHAERAYLRLLQLAPKRGATYNDLSQLYLDFAQYSKAHDMALQGLHVEPDQPVLLNTLALALASLGRVKDALEAYRKIVRIAPQLATSHSNMLLTMHYSTDVGPEEMAAEHRRWGLQHAPPSLATRDFPNSPQPGRRLRVGFVSPDFRRHSVMFFFESLLDHRNREAIEVFCYGEVRVPDDVTQRIRRKIDQYRNISDMPDPQVAAMIRGDGIDILVDLAGHAGTSRTTLLGYKPAPVQVTWCGYPDTTGIEAVDYRITDWLADPAGAEEHYTETLCRLPGCFLCYRPPDVLPELAPPPSMSGGPVTFGSFNREFKLSRETYDMWARILRAVPGSRILLKSVSGADQAMRKLWLDEFEKRGVAAERIQMVGFIPDQAGHLAGYRNVDVALDPYPYHGTTTTLDALVMSVPVITLEGYNHASRVGVSLLTSMGLEEFIAASPDEYVALAIELAGQPARIAELHRTLRERLLRSPLCDGAAFTRNYEFALRGMWCRWCRDQGVALSSGQEAMAAFRFPGAAPGEGA